MSARFLRSSSAPGPEENLGERSKPYRLAWACLPVLLALSAAFLLLFGFSWWTALGVALLLACPASAAVAYYLGKRRYPRLPKSKRDV